MTDKQQTSTALVEHLNHQNMRIHTLKNNLDYLIAKRQNKSYISQLALNYGETSWWKKALLSLIILPSTAAIIYFSGASLLIMLPILALYFLSAFFLSNHYDKDHGIQTETLLILENILAESTEALVGVQERLNKAVKAIENIHHAEEKKHAALKQQVGCITANNQGYQKIIAALEPIVEKLNEATQATHENSEFFLIQLAQTHEALTIELKHILENLHPQTTQAIESATDVKQDISTLQVQLQKNMIHMSSFVNALDAVLCELESTQTRCKKQCSIASTQKTNLLLIASEEAINNAQRLIEKLPPSLASPSTCASSLESTARLAP